MTLLLDTLLSGVNVGMLYGLLGLPVVVLYKSTGVANFAVGSISTFLTFVVYLAVVHHYASIGVAIALGLVVGAIAGVLMYLICIRINDNHADHVNNLMRTLALYALLGGLIRVKWAIGEPFAFPPLLQGRIYLTSSFSLPVSFIGTVCVALILACGLWLFFRFTRLGLLFIATAEKPEIADLLGVNTRMLSAIAWAATAVVALVVGVLVAPSRMLSSTMMDPFLLFAFTAAIVGGLTSLIGVFIGGVIVGLTSNLVAVYVGYDPSVIVIFGVLLAVLLWRPTGIFTTVLAKRL